ncbi:MAG: GTP pyrophosphokinase [bacterium]
MSNLDTALALAIKVHANHTDIAGAPYILHPLRVMLKMKTEEEMIVAVLHDVIEDSDLSIGYLEKIGFSKEIVQAVQIVTRDETVNYDDYISNIQTNTIATKVKLADIEDNMNLLRLNTLDEKAVKRLHKYFNSHKKLSGLKN